MEETKKTNHELESVGRRKAVKKIVGGVTVLAAYNMLPVRWEKPIIEQVFLPAHAQTSGCPGCSLKDPCTITISSGNSTSAQVVVQVEGQLDQPIAGLPTTITVTPKGAGIAPPVLSTMTDAQGRFAGTFTITGGPGITAVSAITKVEGADPVGCDISTTVETNATTTQAPQRISSSPSSLSRTNVNDPPDSGDDIYIVFDGSTSLTLVAVADLAAHPPSPNAVIGIDTDYDQASVWEHYDNGGNWTVTSTNVGGGYQPPGSYFVIITGSSGTFRVDFDVAVDTNLPPTATVSNVTVQPWT